MTTHMKTISTAETITAYFKRNRPGSRVSGEQFGVSGEQFDFVTRKQWAIRFRRT